MRWVPPRGRALVLAPHPDDETIGCGGAIILHRRRKDPVRVVFATTGSSPKLDGSAAAARSMTSKRRAESRAAARALGVRELEHWDYEDGRLSEAGDLKARIEAVLELWRPDLVYRPGEDDPHADHRALAVAARSALRSSRNSILDCRYEVWACPRPTGVLDITPDFDRKSLALAAYRSQLARANFQALARRLGASRGLLLGGALYGEGFRIKRWRAK